MKNLAIAVPFALSVLTGCGKVESDRFESCSKNNVECCCCKCNEEKDSSVGLFRKVLAGVIGAVPVRKNREFENYLEQRIAPYRLLKY